MTKRRKVIIASILIIVAATGGGVFYARATNNPEPVETTSKSKTAQSDYSDGKPRESNSAGGAAQGGAVDNKGRDVNPTDPGTTSESGVITVQSPAKNSKIAPGAVIKGVASGVTQIQYRLIDEQVGVLAQGALNVVGGSYSGTLQFTSRSEIGRLDIFSFDTSGSEQNNVEIPVQF